MTNTSSSISQQLDNLGNALPITRRDGLLITAWVLGLWAWGAFVNFVPGIGGTAVLAVSIVPLSIFFWNKPEYGIIVLMFFSSGFLSPDFIDIRLPIGGFEMRDIVLFLMFGLTFFKRLLQKNLTIPWWPVGGILLVFFIMTIVSLINAIFYEGVAANWALGEARLLFFYLLFFITAWSLNDKRSLLVVTIGSFVISNITGAIVLIQQYLGPNQLLLEGMNDGGWAVYATEGATRVLPPGIVHMYFMMLIAIGLTLFWRHNRRHTNMLLLQAGFLGVSLLFTFTRAAWVASGVATLLILIVSFPAYKDYIFRILVLGTAGLLVLVGFFGVLDATQGINNATLSGFVDRFTSIFDQDTSESLSLQWREFEAQQATKSIIRNPWIGVGLGNSYRNLTVFQEEAEGKGIATTNGLEFERYDRLTRYAHSSYYNITVKMGIPALITLLLFFIVTIMKSIEDYYSVSDGLGKAFAVAIVSGLFGILQWSIFHAQLMDASSTPVIGLAIGMLASISYINKNKVQSSAS